METEPTTADARQPPAKQPLAPLRGFAVLALAGLAAGIVAAVAYLRYANYDPTPPLTPELYYAARDRWRASGPKDYDVEIAVAGPQAATYRVQVRGGLPEAAWRNGHPLKQRRTFGTWSVDGMFSTIARDIDALERRAAGEAGINETELILRAEFDPQYSYPRIYKRIEWGSRRGSTATTATWEVVEFRVVKPGGE
jgi:hypothetical protein